MCGGGFGSCAAVAETDIDIAGVCSCKSERGWGRRLANLPLRTDNEQRVA